MNDKAYKQQVKYSTKFMPIVKYKFASNGISPSKIFDAYGRPCNICGTLEYLTRHHLKNERGKKTGEIEILCRRCHNDAEEEYRLLGIVKLDKITVSDNQQLQLDYINGLIPYYSLNPKNISTGIMN